MPEPTNSQRADFAREALAKYILTTGTDIGENAVTDLLTDLMHYCAEVDEFDEPISFGACLERAEYHFLSEVEEEKEQAYVHPGPECHYLGEGSTGLCPVRCSGLWDCGACDQS